MNDVLAFIRQHMAATGRFPTNREIVAGCDCMPWRVGSVLTALVNRGDLRRRQIAEKGTRHQAKYAYEVVVREAAE